jgi:hypothetical protein
VQPCRPDGVVGLIEIIDTALVVLITKSMIDCILAVIGDRESKNGMVLHSTKPIGLYVTVRRIFTDITGVVMLKFDSYLTDFTGIKLLGG